MVLTSFNLKVIRKEVEEAVATAQAANVVQKRVRFVESVKKMRNSKKNKRSKKNMKEDKNDVGLGLIMTSGRFIDFCLEQHLRTKHVEIYILQSYCQQKECSIFRAYWYIRA